MGRNIHDEDVADATSGTKAGIALRDSPKQLVRMQTSLHQQLGPTQSHELDGLVCGGLAVWDVDDLDAV